MTGDINPLKYCAATGLWQHSSMLQREKCVSSAWRYIQWQDGNLYPPHSGGAENRKAGLIFASGIALTTQITERLKRVFGHRLGIYHSKFPDAEAGGDMAETVGREEL